MGNKVVYIHKRKDTGKVFYVGIGSMDRPYTQRKNKMWLGIVKKYGYDVEVLYKNIDWEEAIIIERALICSLGRRDLGKGYLANMTDGGEGNQNMLYTDEWKERQRKASTGRKQSMKTLRKKSLSLKGKLFQQERKNNISLSKKGKYLGVNNPSAKLNEEQVIQIRKLFSEGRSKLSIAKEFGCGWSTVARIVKGTHWAHIKNQL
jgi:hypothetical protein